MTASGTVILGDELEEEKAYWLAKLAGDPPLVALPADLAGGDPSGRRGEVPLVLPGDAGDALLRLCGGRQALVFAALVAAVKACLYKHTGARDISVGSVIHADHAEVAALNRVLVLRDRVDGAMRGRELLEAVRSTVAEAYAHGKFPYRRLLRLCGGRRGALFRVAVLLAPMHRREWLAEAEPELTVAAALEGGCLRAAVGYDADRFQAATVATFAAHVGRLLAALVAEPETAVDDLELLTDSERELLVAADRGRAAPPETTVVELFTAQAARTPGAAAVVRGGRELSYAGLERRAGAIAGRLRRCGVGRGDRVAVLLPHTPDAVAALLGVLAAGAAFVPLDPFHPPRRIAHSLADSAAVAVLTVAALAGRLDAAAAERLLLDDDLTAEEPADGGAAGSPAARPGPDDLAYLIYTSGSTGEPKGVGITHRALAGYVRWAVATYDRGERLVFALCTSLAFDLTLTSIFVPLAAGGRVVVYSQESEGGFPITDVVADGRVDALKATPSHLTLLRGDADAAGDGRLKRLIVGGEAFAGALAREVLEAVGPEVEIYNEYGPTEATVGCIVHRFDPGRDLRAAVAIGRPVAGARAWALDRALRPVAPTVVGELYLGGEGLARCYHRRPRQTAASFLPCPFGPPGGRMYRTGDLVRWLPLGAGAEPPDLEFVGRADDQIKFHGYRVELGELRAVLNRHPEVRDSLIRVVRDDQGYDVMLAYYLSRRELEVAELRRFLAAMVIEETLPNHFVHLRAFPLTLNGKVNVAALPDLDDARRRLEREHTAPRTPVEERLAAIWGQVLGISRVGIHDNFFELGGHSLMATQVISRMRAAFGVELPIRALFDHPTVAELGLETTRAQLVAAGGGEEAERLLAEVAGLSDGAAAERLAAEGREAGKE